MKRRDFCITAGILSLSPSLAISEMAENPQTKELKRLIKIGAERNIVVLDIESTIPGNFSKRLLQLIKVVMRKNAGNGTWQDPKRGILTDLFVSPKTKKQIVDMGGKGLVYKEDDKLVMCGVNIKVMEEPEKLFSYYFDELKGTLPTNKEEFVIGVDNRNIFAGKDLIETDILLGAL